MADLQDDDEDISEELALGAAGEGADPGTATEFLRAKTELLRAQVRQIHVGHFREWLYASAEIVLGFFILLVFAGVISAVWSAAHDNGLVIESFSVPPDFVSRGLTGEVVANQVLDRLAAMQSQTSSSRAASSYTNDWGKDIKVQIPDTGVSIGELNSYLRDWLGSATHISGEIYRDGDTVTITTRVGSVAISATGPQADFGKLLQKVAEGVYRQTQPYRYAVYLEGINREKESEGAYLNLIATGSQQDKVWAYIGLSTIYQARNEYPKSLGVLHKALALKPDFVMAYINIGGEQGNLQHDEASYQALHKLIELAGQGQSSDMSNSALQVNLAQARANVAGDLGDYQQQLVEAHQAQSIPDIGNQLENVLDIAISAYGFMHDGGGARGALASLPPTNDVNAQLNRKAEMLLVDSVLGDWQNLLTGVQSANKALDSFGPAGMVFKQRVAVPLMARAQAGLGDFKDADATIAQTPLDCDLCVRIRGRIAMAEHRWDAAAHWFALQSARSPSIPTADSDWGDALVAKGDYDGAIAKFASSHEKGPHFADPLEGWGEALIGKKRSDLALAKFEEADKYAPNWGRLHLIWGEALLYTGDKDGARKQFAMARGLDLFPDEKSELSRISR